MIPTKKNMYVKEKEEGNPGNSHDLTFLKNLNAAFAIMNARFEDAFRCYLRLRHPSSRVLFAAPNTCSFSGFCSISIFLVLLIYFFVIQYFISNRGSVFYI